MSPRLYTIAVLTDEDDVLLLQRNATQTFGANLYSLVGGKVNQGETALQVVQREVIEAVDLDIPQSEFTLMHVLHRQGTETEFIALFFHADISELEPQNKKQDTYQEIKFYDVQELPDNMIPAHKQALDSIVKSIIYSEHGWKK